jgi:hypothetical protein
MRAQDALMGIVDAEIKRRRVPGGEKGAAPQSFYKDIGLNYTHRTAVVTLSKWRSNGFDVRALDRVTLWAHTKPADIAELLAERLGLRVEDIHTLAAIPGIEYALRDPDGTSSDVSDAFVSLFARVRG